MKKQNVHTIIMHHGKKIIENPQGKSMLYLTYASPLGKIMRWLLTSRFISTIGGILARSSISRYAIKPFVKKHAINLDNFNVPATGFRSFNDFFIRTIKPECRPITQEPNAIASPADSKLYAIPTLTPESIFFVKALPFSLTTFLGPSHDASPYTHGTLIIFRLSPHDYHWFHMPASGTPRPATLIPGRLHSVNPLVYKQNIQPLITNQRLIIPIDLDNGTRIMMVAVGALMVGSITTTYQPNNPLPTGSPLGYFAFGGSTIALLFPHNGICINEELCATSNQGIETVVQMGQKVGTLYTPTIKKEYL